MVVYANMHIGMHMWQAEVMPVCILALFLFGMQRDHVGIDTDRRNDAIIDHRHRRLNPNSAKEQTKDPPKMMQWWLIRLLTIINFEFQLTIIFIVTIAQEQALIETPSIFQRYQSHEFKKTKRKI